MPPLPFHHLAIQVRDLARAEAFYCGLLGLRVVRRWPWPAEQGRAGERALWVALGDDGARGFLALEACEGEAGGPEPFRHPAPGLHLLALRIHPQERARWEERLEAAGLAVEHRTRWTIYLRDPEGNRIGLSHHPDGAP